MSKQRLTKAETKECDYCKQQGSRQRAYFDSPTKDGPWAFMCRGHMASKGIMTSVTTEFVYDDR